MTNEEYLAYLKSDKWKSIALRRMAVDDFQCQCCGSRGTMANKLEVHHLSYRYLGHEENRIFEDLVTLCGACHKSIHNVMNRKTSPSGRRGWSDNSHIPQITVYDVTKQGETEWKEKQA